MQSRLTRSRQDRMIAGVCGGLGAYFNIDPVIVRLIFVLVTLASGVGLPIYLLLLVIMPKSTDPLADPQQSFNRVGGQPNVSAHGGDFRYDPLTGAPLSPERAVTSATVTLDPSALPPDPNAPVSPNSNGRGRNLGVLLIGLGGRFFLSQLGIDLGMFLPVLMIGAGFYLLRKR